MEAAGEATAELTASFSAEEQGLIERLRAKYSTGPAPAPAPAPPPAAAAAAAVAQPAACRLCAECHGTGTVAEAYNHRTLERCCTQCGGQGTVRHEGGSGGGSNTQNGSGGSTHNIRASAQSGGTRMAGSGKGAHGRLASWEAELEALKQSLAGVSDSQELQLKAALVLELGRAAAAMREGVAAAKQGDQVLSPPMAQGIAQLSLGSSAGEESKKRSGLDATSTGEEGASGCCTPAADPTEASKAAAGAAAATAVAAGSTRAH